MRKVILLTALLFIVSLGYSNSQTKKKQKGQVQFSEIIKKIEKKFDVSITYETEISFKMTEKQAQKVIKMKTVEKALAETVKLKDISFKKIRNDYYVLSKKEKKSFETSESNSINSVKERVITGVVTDKDGEPIPGVVVSFEKSSIATMTDLYGKFSMNIPTETGVLVFSYVGYKTAKINVTEESNYTVKLESDEFGLDEVIVSGVAGNTPTKKLTVTVEKVGGEQLKKAPASSSASMLQGKLAGVMVKSAYGTPGGGATVKMRGATTITGSSAPLILVDGIITQTNLADINVDDIESVEVVKGAAAAALYGSRAANGVIVVTTKRGKNIKNKFQIKIRNEYGVSNIQKTIDLSTHHPYQLAADNADFPYTKYEGVTYDDDGEVIGGTNPILTDSAYADQPYAVVRDLQKEFFKQGTFYTNFASLSNKSEKSNLYLSFENNKNTGVIFSTDGYTRQNLRFNADTKINDYISFSSSNLFMNAFSDQAAGSTFEAVLFLSPDLDLHEENSDGTLYRVNPKNKFSNYQNPLYPLYNLDMYSKRNSFMSNFTTKLTLTDWLNIDAKYTIEKLNKKSYTYNKKGYLYGSYTNGQLQKSNSLSNTQNYQVTANLNNRINDFTIKTKLSYLYESNDWDNTSLTGKDFIFTGVSQFDFVDQSLSSASSGEGIIRSQNLFGIVDADYMDKYLFSGLLRRDGSSLFGKNERWHTYYRLAGAYRITEDIDIPYVQEFKLRAAVGTSGLRPSYSAQHELVSVTNGVPYFYQLGNNDLKPSQSKEVEYALDIQFLNIFSLDASYSNSVTTDAILLVPLASHALGFAYQTRNAGTLASNTFELSLNAKVINKSNTKLSFGVNYDRVRQNIVDLEMNKYYTGPEGSFLVEPGQNFGIIIGKKWLRSLDDMSKQLPDGATIDDYTINSDGYVILKGTEGSTTESPIALDEDNDGTPDKVIIADCNTDFNLNFNTNFSYKGFTFYMLWGIKQGGDVYNKTKQYLFFENRAKVMDQFGKPEDQKKSIYYYNVFYDADQINSYFVEDGSFVKLREASLSYVYNFNTKSKLSKIVKSVKVGLIGRNLLTFSKYSGYDPEVGTTNSANFSYDNYGYPNFRTITGSLEFTF